MSVVCNPVIPGTFEHSCSCDCSLVSFTVNLKNVCNGATVGFVAIVKYTPAADDTGVLPVSKVVATVCKKVKIDLIGAKECECVTYPAHFDNIVADIPSCTELTPENKSDRSHVVL